MQHRPCLLTHAGSHSYYLERHANALSYLNKHSKLVFHNENEKYKRNLFTPSRHKLLKLFINILVEVIVVSRTSGFVYT